MNTKGHKPDRQWGLIAALALFGLALVSPRLPAVSGPYPPDPGKRLEALIGSLHQPVEALPQPLQSQALAISPSMRVSGCGNYPYHAIDNRPSGTAPLVHDIKSGLRQGLMCLLGRSPQGPLHVYHEHQALLLMNLLEDGQPKTVQCVEDELFAYAIARAPGQAIESDPLLAGHFAALPAPAILLDTYRIGGLLSRKFQPDTYRDFFKLDAQQIDHHLTGKPLQVEGMHRYRNLPGLMFHEMVHWLGHEHSYVQPDVTFLYETCCFGGSEHVDDADLNKAYQTRACDILRDDELWSANGYRKMRLWKYKGYNQLKLDMREHYR